jgi:arylsulfatase A-like enzyme
MTRDDAGTRVPYVLWLGAGLAAGVLVGLVRTAQILAATEYHYAGYDLYAVLARRAWWCLTAHGAAGLGVSAGLVLPTAVSRGGGFRRTAVSLIAAVAGALSLAVTYWLAGPGVGLHLSDAFFPTLPRGSMTGLLAAGGLPLAVGLVLSPVLAATRPRFLSAGPGGPMAAVSGVSAGVLLGLLTAGTLVAPPRPLNVVLITLDALRPDHLHCYGYRRNTSPNIDALAARGMLFLDANANATWTLPSLASIATGKLPIEHGATTIDSTLPRSELTLAEILQQHGYRTGGAFATGFVAEPYAMSQGFQSFVGDKFKDETTAGRMLFDSPPWITRFAVRFMREARGRPFFLQLHYLKPHYPYVWDPKYTFARREPEDLPRAVWLDWLVKRRQKLSASQLDEVMALYDGAILYADEHVGMVLDELKRLGLAGRTLVIVSADHGEEFMDHGSFGHWLPYQEVLHVPLVVAAPGWAPPGRRCVMPVQLLDLRPTILDFCGIPETGSKRRGQSLVPLLSGRPGYRLTDIVTSYSESGNESGTEVIRSIRRGNWKLLWRIQQGTVELYDLSSDPRERHNLAGEGRPAEKELRAAVTRLKPASGNRGANLSDETRRRLRALGYLQ